MKHTIKAGVMDTFEGLAEHAMQRALKIQSSALSAGMSSLEAEKMAFEESMDWLYKQDSKAFDLEG